MFFEETKESKYIPRSVFVDLEPSVIDGMMTGTHQHLYQPEQLVMSKVGPAGNYAKGHNALGSQTIDQVMDAIRKVADKCSDV